MIVKSLSPDETRHLTTAILHSTYGQWELDRVVTGDLLTEATLVSGKVTLTLTFEYVVEE